MRTKNTFKRVLHVAISILFLVLCIAEANAKLFSFSYTFDASQRGTAGRVLTGVVDGTLQEDGDIIHVHELIAASLGGFDYDKSSSPGLRAIALDGQPAISLSGDTLDIWICPQGFSYFYENNDDDFSFDQGGGDCQFGTEGGFLLLDNYFTDLAGLGYNSWALACNPNLAECVAVQDPQTGPNYRESDIPLNRNNWTAQVLDDDADNDGLPNTYELANGLDPLDALDGSLDADNDGLSNFEEFELGTDINNADTDGDGITDNIDLNPLEFDTSSANQWKQVEGGLQHSSAIKMDGTIWSWGWNLYGQLGDGKYADSHTPVRIGNDTDWQSIETGSAHSFAIKSDGSLWGWGLNSDGSLGDGTTIERNSPVRIGSDTNWQRVIGGAGHSIGIKADGTLWAWGWNLYGQLGDGTNTDRNTPVQIGSQTDWQSINTDGNHTMAIKLDGTLWAWGQNKDGELGDGTNIDRNTPVQIGNDSNWQSVSVSLAIKTDGTLWAWGQNSKGQLGNGTQTDSNIPIQIGEDTNWQSVSAGYQHSLAIKKDGTLWAWGYNLSGQLGNGIHGNSSGSKIPIQIDDNTNWLRVDAGFEHSLAIKTDGTLWSWGWNVTGQLGNGTDYHINIPVQVSGEKQYILQVLPDLNGDTIPEIGILCVDRADLFESKISLEILNGIDRATLDEIVWVDNFDDATLSLHLIPDMNNNGVDEIGLFGIQDIQNNRGKPQMFVRDLKTGNKVTVYNWPANWTQVSALVLDDMSGDGVAEIAIQGRFKVGNRPQLVVKMGGTNTTLDTYGYPELFISPEYFQHSDSNGDGVAEISTFGRLRSNNKIQVKIASGLDSKDRFKAYNFPDKWNDISWHRLDDKNGDGIDDWGLFGTNKQDGRPQLIVKDGTDPRGAISIYAWPAQIQNAQFFSIPDMNNDGVDEVAAAGRRSDNGRYQFQVQDGINRNVVLANHNLNLNLLDISFHVLPDLSGDEQVEIGFLGINLEDQWELVIRDGDTANGELTKLNFYSNWLSAPAIISLGDTNKDGSPDFLVYGQDANGRQILKFDPLSIPTVLGTYSTGPVTRNLISCSDTGNNGPYIFTSGSLEIATQNSINFTGTIMVQAIVNEVSIVSTQQLTGTVSNDGTLTGTYLDLLTRDNQFSNRVNGTFTGLASQDTVTIQSTGRDIIYGGFCKYSEITTFERD